MEPEPLKQQDSAKLRQSSSWVFMNDPMYSTTAENKEIKSKKHHKSKAKNKSCNESAHKGKRNKSKKSSSRHIMNRDPITQNKQSILMKSKHHSRAQNLQSNRNTFEPNRSSYLQQQPSFDFVALKKSNRNLSPAKLLNFKNNDPNVNTLVAYRDPQLQNVSDLRKLEELRKNARSYTDLHNERFKNSHCYTHDSTMKSNTPMKSSRNIGSSKGNPKSFLTVEGNKCMQHSQSFRKGNTSTSNSDVRILLPQNQAAQKQKPRRSKEKTELLKFKQKLNKTISMKELESQIHK